MSECLYYGIRDLQSWRIRNMKEAVVKLEINFWKLAGWSRLAKEQFLQVTSSFSEILKSHQSYYQAWESHQELVVPENPVKVLV